MIWIRSVRARIGSIFSRKHIESFGGWLFAPRKFWYRIPLTALVVFVVVNIASRATTTPPSTDTPDPLRQVSLYQINGHGSSIGPLTVVGKVSALSKAELKADAGGRVTSVDKHIGDRVSAGQIIATFENSIQRASVLQAEGALESAQANLARLEKGSREETLAVLETNKARTEKALKDTKESILSSLKSIYGANDTLVHGQLDTLFSNPRTNSPVFLLTTSDSRLVQDIEHARTTLEDLLTKESVRANTLSLSQDLNAELETALQETREIATFVDLVASAVNRAIPSSAQTQTTISTYITTVSTVRTAISATLQQISGLSQDYAAKIAAAKNAGSDLSQGITPARTEDIAQAQAGVKSAQGAYALALAQLEKTIIRSPISGTIDTLSVDLGANVPQGTLIAVVTNNAGLEIRTSVSPDEAPFIRVGGSVTLENGLTGKITRIGSGIDAVTKNVEVRIAIDDTGRTLANGETVSLSISRQDGKVGDTEGKVILPLSAVKLFADRTVVFTVNNENRLEEHKIVLGPLLGDSVLIESGITRGMTIVKDARGLKTGEEVVILQN